VLPVEAGHALVEVDSGGDRAGAHPEPDRGQRHIRLDPDETGRAPRSRATSATLRMVVNPNESSTSTAATSMITPVDRHPPICSTRSLRNPVIAVSSSAVCTDATSYEPDRRIEKSAGLELIARRHHPPRRRTGQPLGFSSGPYRPRWIGSARSTPN
jgi:hypothetical protein